VRYGYIHFFSAYRYSFPQNLAMVQKAPVRRRLLLVQYDIEKIIIFLMLVGFVFVLIIFIYLLGEKSRENLKKDNFQIFDLNS